jgi:hypothetical protein
MATSSFPVGLFLPAPILPISAGEMPRKMASWAIHCSSSGRRWTPGDQGEAYDGLSGSRRSHQNPSVVGEEISGSLPLRPRQRSLERGLQGLAVLPLVFDNKLNSVFEK